MSPLNAREFFIMLLSLFAMYTAIGISDFVDRMLIKYSRRNRDV